MLLAIAFDLIVAGSQIVEHVAFILVIIERLCVPLDGILILVLIGVVLIVVFILIIVRVLLVAHLLLENVHVVTVLHFHGSIFFRYSIGLVYYINYNILLIYLRF